MSDVHKQLSVFACATQIARNLGNDGVRHAAIVAVILNDQCRPNLGGWIGGPQVDDNNDAAFHRVL